MRDIGRRARSVVCWRKITDVYESRRTLKILDSEDVCVFHAALSQLLT